jgi:exopolysaccharide biosynthesis protein
VESAAVMRALGAREAVNLDGGGSTTFTLGASVLTRPSDATGERPIGDAIVVRRVHSMVTGSPPRAAELQSGRA